MCMVVKIVEHVNENNDDDEWVYEYRHLVVYDIKKSQTSKDRRTRLRGHLERMGAKYVSDSQYLLCTDSTAEEIKDRLKSLLRKRDSLTVNDLDSDDYDEYPPGTIPPC